MSKSEEVYYHVKRRIEYLSGIADQGTGKGMLANLRRGIGKEPGELPELWGMIFEKMPDEIIDAAGAEWAVYTALTLYALHQQGKTENVHADGISFGTAARALVQNEDDRDRILKRLNLVATAPAPKDLAYHLRGIIQLLKGTEARLDYARLAKELYQFRDPEKANRIRLSWARDFYRQSNQNEKERSS